MNILRKHNIFYYKQLQCTVRDGWMWNLINDTWLNKTNFYRNENNVINLMAFVKHDHVAQLGKVKEDNADCLFFILKYANYTNESKP